MILESCDLPSLAALSAVSMHFLRRASPLIYKEITVDGKVAARLFCERVSPPMPLFRIFFSKREFPFFVSIEANFPPPPPVPYPSLVLLMLLLGGS